MNITVPLVEAPCLTLSVRDPSVLLTGCPDARAPHLDEVSQVERQTAKMLQEVSRLPKEEHVSSLQKTLDGNSKTSGKTGRSLEWV